MKVRKKGFSEYTRLDKALKMISSNVNELDSELVSFEEAAGRILDENIRSKVNVPPFDRAAMDGFAVRAENTFGADENDPKELRVIGSIEIGSGSDLNIGSGEAAEIATGAVMPEGADAVIMLEETQGESSRLEVISPVTPGKNVSSRGEDVKAGQTVLKSPRQIWPADVGMLAATGNLEVKVKKKPKVAIAATGNELRKPGEKLKEGEITENNSYSLCAEVEKIGGESTRLGAVKDQENLIKNILEKAQKFDTLLFTGGSSVGEGDLVPEVISNNGELVFHGVSIRPGGPSAFGIVDDTPVFSLSGFPVAALIAFEMLVKPCIRMMEGRKPTKFRPRIKTELMRKISSSLGRVDIVRMRIQEEKGTYKAEPIRVTGSSILRTMTEADGIVVVPEEKEGFSEGEEIEVELLKTPF